MAYAFRSDVALLHICPLYNYWCRAMANDNRHIGFEELSMRNINVALKGGNPLTPVNMHLITVNAEGKL